MKQWAKGKKQKQLQVVKYNGNRMQSMETATAADSLYLQSTLCLLRHPDEPELKVTKVSKVKEALCAIYLFSPKKYRATGAPQL
jgi:hypothetical protein